MVHSLKDGALEPSSPNGHMGELIREKAVTNPVLFIYSDGGPNLCQCAAWSDFSISSA